MESDDLVQALRNSVKEACLKMNDDGKSGMIYCRDHWSSPIIYNKNDTQRFIDIFLKKMLLSSNEYEKVKKEIENSSLPDM
jgi:hypothetical protein